MSEWPRIVVGLIVAASIFTAAGVMYHHYHKASVYVCYYGQHRDAGGIGAFDFNFGKNITDIRCFRSDDPEDFVCPYGDETILAGYTYGTEKDFS